MTQEYWEDRAWEYECTLKDLVDLHSEEWAMTGGGPGVKERWEKAWARANELFEP